MTANGVGAESCFRTAVVPAAGERSAWQFGSGALEGHVAGPVIASYLHTHWAGVPGAAERITGAAREYQRSVR